MGGSCSRTNSTEKQESIFNVQRKITNTIRDLWIKERELTSISMPKKKAEIMELNKQGRREQALISFRTYKKFQKTRDKYWTMKENLELVRHELDTQQTNIVVTEGFKRANQMMEKALENTVLKDVDTIVDKCREHMQSGSEIFTELSQPLTPIEEEEEELLQDELEKLMKSTEDPKPHKLSLSTAAAEGVSNNNNNNRGDDDDANIVVKSKRVKKYKGTLKEPLLVISN